MAPYYKIFDGSGNLKDTVQWVDNGSGGLPDWFFDDDHCYFDFYIDEKKDLVEWIPACGPAPCWIKKLSEFADDAAMFKSFDDWVKLTY